MVQWPCPIQLRPHVYKKAIVTMVIFCYAGTVLLAITVVCTGAAVLQRSREKTAHSDLSEFNASWFPLTLLVVKPRYGITAVQKWSFLQNSLGWQLGTRLSQKEGLRIRLESLLCV